MTPIAAISLVDADRVWLSDVGFCAHAIRDETPLVVPDLSEDERFALNPLVRGGPQVRLYAGAPLRVRSGHHLGTLCVMDHQPRTALSWVERDRLATMASLVVDHLEARRSEFANAIARGFREAALAANEAAMFTRGEAAAADAHRMLALCLGELASFGLLDSFAGVAAGGGRAGPASALFREVGAP